MYNKENDFLVAINPDKGLITITGYDDEVFRYDLEEWIDQLNVNLEKLNLSIDDLVKPPVTIEEIANLVYALVLTAETVIAGNKMGIYKKQIVLAIWDYYEEKYKLIDSIDKSIDLKEIFGTFIGSILETVDGPIVRFIIENILITTFVKLILKEGVFDKLSVESPDELSRDSSFDDDENEENEENDDENEENDDDDDWNEEDDDDDWNEHKEENEGEETEEEKIEV